MRINELAQKLGVTTVTLGAWIKNFEEFFSAAANLKAGKHRSFTQSDLDTLATIAQLSGQGLNYDAIRKRLNESGDRIPFEAVNMGLSPAVISDNVQQIVDSAGIRAELETAKAQLDFYMAELEKRDQQLSDKDAAITQLHQTIRELSERAARAEGRLDEIERNRKPRRWFGG